MPATARTRYQRLAWSVLGYTVLVILFGAWVRITGSGAGCGEHWPSCHGDLVPRNPTVATVIEFTHRLTSGLCLFAVLALVWAARRTFPRGHAARTGAALAVLFTITEALVGAGLVRFGLVDKNDSIARAVVMSIHLINTSLLTGALAYAAWSGRMPAPSRPPPRRAARWRPGRCRGASPRPPTPSSDRPRQAASRTSSRPGAACSSARCCACSCGAG